MENTPNMPAEVRCSRLIFGAGSFALCIASILAIAAAITCHTAGAELAHGLSWIRFCLHCNEWACLPFIKVMLADAGDLRLSYPPFFYLVSLKINLWHCLRDQSRASSSAVQKIKRLLQ